MAIKRPTRRKVCYFCEKKKEPNYKNYEELRQFLTDRARIKSRRQTNLCNRHQKRLALQIKRARQLALLPYVVV